MSGSAAAEGARLKRPSWKDPRLLVGILLVLASVVGVVSLVGAADQTTEAYAAREPIAVGETLTADKLHRVKVRLGEVEQHYLTPEAGLDAGLVAVQRIGKDQLLPRESVGQLDGLDRKPVAVTVEETLPAQAVAGSRVDVWVALPDTRNGFSEPTLLLSGAEIAQITPGSTALGSSRSTVVMVLVPGRPDAQVAGGPGQQSKDRGRVEPGRYLAMSIPVVTVGDSRDDLVGGLERLHGPVSVVRRCSELAELLAACQSGLARAAVVAAGSEELTASLVDRLSAVGVVVIALTDNPEETVRLRTIGVAAEARAVDAAALAARISAAVAQLSGTGDGPGTGRGWTAPPPVAAAGQVPRSSGAHTVTASTRREGPDHCGLGSGRRAGPDPGGRQHRGGAGRGRPFRAAGRRRQLRCQRGRPPGSARRGRRAGPGLPAGRPGPA